jgi:hypothetical protein
LTYRQGGEKLYFWVVFNHYSFLFFKNKLRWGITLPHRQGNKKLHI